MKFNFLKAAAATLLLTISGYSQAGLIQADYLIANDKLAVSDTVTKLTWLDLSVSSPWTFANWTSFIQPNAGWRLATNSEVATLFSNAFPSFSVLHGSAGVVDVINESLISNFLDFRALFGSTTMNPNNVDTYGLFKNENGQSEMMGASRWANTYRVFSTDFNSATPENSSGLYIVRATPQSVVNVAVSAPSTVAVLGLGLLAMVFRPRRKN